jgi:putative phosphoribosyl transferase
MYFQNREEAAHLLAERLSVYRGHNPLVLGVPRGAVPMAAIIAEALDGELDVVLVRKLRAPGQAELAIGAIDEDGRVLKGTYFEVASDAYVREEIHIQQEILRMRRALYTHAMQAIGPAGRTVIIVDDGLATGSSMLAAIRSVKARGAKRIIVAVGVAPASSMARLAAAVDEVVCLYSTDDFDAVGQFFEDFSEVTDHEVVAALERVRLRREPSAVTTEAHSEGALRNNAES